MYYKKSTSERVCRLRHFYEQCIVKNVFFVKQMKR